MNNLMQKIYLKVENLIHREDGQDVVEYALLITLVALGVVTGVNSVSSAINSVFTNISTTLS